MRPSGKIKFVALSIVLAARTIVNRFCGALLRGSPSDLTIALLAVTLLQDLYDCTLVLINCRNTRKIRKKRIFARGSRPCTPPARPAIAAQAKRVRTSGRGIRAGASTKRRSSTSTRRGDQTAQRHPPHDKILHRCGGLAVPRRLSAAQGLCSDGRCAVGRTPGSCRRDSPRQYQHAGIPDGLRNRQSPEWKNLE